MQMKIICFFFETSAKENNNVTQSINKLISIIDEKKKNKYIDADIDLINESAIYLKKNERVSKRGCLK